MAIRYGRPRWYTTTARRLLVCVAPVEQNAEVLFVPRMSLPNDDESTTNLSLRWTIRASAVLGTLVDELLAWALDETETAI